MAKHKNWGAITILIHWISFFAILFLFISGILMVTLSYYNYWYHKLPFWHKSIGVILFIITIIRILWVSGRGRATSIDTHKAWEKKISHIVHFLLYLVLLIVLISGYFMTTSEGSDISVFDWFKVPHITTLLHAHIDLLGQVHKFSSYCLIVLVSLHTLGALKHHIIDKDDTLKRMFNLFNK
ncbi:cytochrome b [Thiotrichales bacterium 19S3-7]|nr:cytochrome b [Thiotrichales bacterium 19S3-7]MCF6801173.1 cytochrome b [Thiotrichales bacterium 19S3-11]